MNERAETGELAQPAKKFFIAVRTMDRRSFVSPTSATPDFFEFNVPSPARSMEDAALRLMRSEHGIVVNSDHHLSTPEDDDSTGYAVYQRHTVDYTEAGKHGLFTPHEVNEARRDLVEMSHDTTGTYTPEELRYFRVKAHLFRQVVTLFNDRGLRRPR